MDIQQARATFRSPNLADYPELAGYSREQIHDETIGGGALYLAARMVRTMRLNRGDIVLDLGCGKGGTVEFLRHLLKHLKPGGQLAVGGEVLSDEFTPEQLAHPPYVYAFKLPPPNENVDVFADDFSKRANHSLLLQRASCKRGRSSQLEHCYRRQQILAALDGNTALPVQVDLSCNPHPVL